MSDLWSDRLSEYLDGELATAEHAELERHLLTCAECARDLDALRQVALRARALPNAGPAADLWPAIQRRIARSPRRVFALPRFELPSHFHFTLPQAVAAGVALMLISGVSVYLVLHQMSAPLAPARGGVSGIGRVTGPTATLTPNVTPAPATQPHLREGTAPATRRSRSSRTRSRRTAPSSTPRRSASWNRILPSSIGRSTRRGGRWRPTRPVPIFTSTLPCK